MFLKTVPEVWLIITVGSEAGRVLLKLEVKLSALLISRPDSPANPRAGAWVAAAQPTHLQPTHAGEERDRWRLRQLLPCCNEQEINFA